MASRSRILLWASLSGVLWALAWPAVGGVAFLAFVAWLPLLHAERLHDQRTAQRPRAFVPYVLAAVFVWNACCSWWFFAVSEPLGTRLISGFSPMVINSLLMTIPWWLKRMVHRRKGMAWSAWAFGCFWLALERLHHGWDLQWPWFSLGNVFGADPAWIQWYEFTGMLGGSVWILLVNFLLDRAFVAWPLNRRTATWYSVAALLILVVPLSWSLWRFRTLDLAMGKPLEVVVVQPCIDPYNEKFGGLDPMRQLDRMLQLAEGVMTDTTALIVMPETALQEGALVEMNGSIPMLRGLWENDLSAAKSTLRLEAFQDSHPQAALLAGMSADRLLPVGADIPNHARPLFHPDDVARGAVQRWYTSYNAALFIPSKGPVDYYNKSKLVAGVEAMPFESLLGYVGNVAVHLGGTSGSLGVQAEREVLGDPPHGLSIVPAICYESVFGEHIAAHVRNGGNMIAIITNDGWWGDSPGYHQHLTFASIRAIETRRDVVRSANTGISCFVDRRGEIRQATTWWTPVAVRGTIHLSEEITFFVEHGDLIGPAAALGTGVFLLLLLVQRSPKRKVALRGST